ncbi:MAG: hypothetical protein ACR5K1_02410, partial [Wolbachia sp.]
QNWPDFFKLLLTYITWITFLHRHLIINLCYFTSHFQDFKQVLRPCHAEKQSKYDSISKRKWGKNKFRDKSAISSINYANCYDPQFSTSSIFCYEGHSRNFCKKTMRHSR